MSGVSTQFSLQDRMTSRLNTMTSSAERLNRSLDATDALSDTIDPGAPFERSATDIGAASRQVDNFNDRQEQAERGAKKVKSAWSSIGGVVKSAVAAFGAKQVIELADSMTTTRARLDLMNDGLQTTEELQDMIMESANRSRASYQTTADAVAKMGIMASDAFSSNEELIAFSELINKQFTIAGTSASGIDAAMLQLTQAMSSGVLRGEELNSVFEQAPTIIQTIADYLDVPIGQIRSMAAEGQLSAGIVKNAMLASADEINARFESMPMTFSQVWTIAKNIVMEAFEPVLTLIGKGAQWIYENWSTIAPIFWGVAGAVLGYAVALGIQTVATWIANGAAKAFFASLLSNPLLWIALVIGVVVAAIYKWVQSVGGLQNAWEICKAALLVAWAAIKVAFWAVYTWIMDTMDKLKLGWQKAGNAIADFMGDLKVSILTVLQDMVNGAIGIINDFIGMLNKIPGVNLSAVEQVTFATTAAAENEANKQTRANDLLRYEAELNEAKAERDAKYQQAKDELTQATDNLTTLYHNAKAEAANRNSEQNLMDWGKFDVGTVDSVKEIEEDVNIADEDLKFLRDVAEMRYVQNFVTLTPTVAVDAKISERVDVDDVLSRIENKLETEFEATAERVYA